MTRETGVDASPVAGAEDAVREADVVITMTTARDPVLQGAWLKPGAHVNAAGVNWASRREVDDETVERSAVVAVDDLDQARIEAGDLILPAAVGRFEWERAVELGPSSREIALNRIRLALVAAKSCRPVWCRARPAGGAALGEALVSSEWGRSPSPAAPPPGEVAGLRESTRHGLGRQHSR